MTPLRLSEHKSINFFAYINTVSTNSKLVNKFIDELLDVCQWWVHCATNWLAAQFRGLWMLASACALHLPTIKVQVFHTWLGVKVRGLVRYTVHWSVVLRIKSKV